MLRSALLSILTLSLVAATIASAQDKDKGHFYFCGPLNTLMAEGSKPPAAVNKGLPFSITISDAGKTLSSGKIDLSIPGASGPLALSLDDLKFQGGKLIARAAIKNNSGTSSQGIRLDIAGATETYKAPDAALKTRSQDVRLPSPISFGDLEPGEISDPVAFEAASITFKPETTQIVVNGVVSGLRYAGSFNIADVGSAFGAEFDSQGRLYIGDQVGQRVVRAGPDGKNAATVLKIEQQLKWMALDPKSGTIAVTMTNDSSVHLYSLNGELKGKLGESNGIDSWSDVLRFDRTGNLLVHLGDHISVIGNGKATARLSQVGENSLDSLVGHDVAADGTLWALANGGLLKIAPTLKTSTKVAIGPGWQLGKITEPRICRVDAMGNVYVAENTDNTEFARISVFNKDGGFVRVFGRGGRTPDPQAPDKYLKGEVYRPRDILFGMDGRVYVFQDNDGGSGNNLCEMYQPF